LKTLTPITPCDRKTVTLGRDPRALEAAEVCSRGAGCFKERNGSSSPKSAALKLPRWHEKIVIGSSGALLK